MLNNRKWIVPFAAFIMLLVAWGLRFERVTTINSGGVRGIFLRDRWTDTTWATLFGDINGQSYTGQTIPEPSPQSVQARENQLMAAPDIAQQVQQLKSALSAQYSAEKKSQVVQVPSRLVSEDPDVWYYETYGVPSPNAQLPDAKKLNAIIDNAKSRAVSELDGQIWHMRNVATGIWAFLLAASFITSALLFLREGKPAPPQHAEATGQEISGP